MADQPLLSESALGWSIFTCILLVILAFCWVYIRKFQSRQESEVVSTITAICALAIALITSALLPVDIFLVSFMKYPNGTYKEWAANNETRGQIEDTVLYGYYTLYSIILFCVFLWIPFVYFYYEERDDDNVNRCSQVKNALKYTVGFAIVCVALLLIGAFVPLEPPPGQNSTQWEKVQYLFEELGSSHGLPALSFSISSLTLIGMLAVITYTAYGMSVLPLNLIKGTRSVVYERLENTEDIDEVEHQIEKLKSKCKDGRPLSSRDRNNLQELEGKLQVLQRRGRHLEVAERNCCTKVGSALRPFKVSLRYLIDSHKSKFMSENGLYSMRRQILSMSVYCMHSSRFSVCVRFLLLDKALHSAGISSGFIIFGTNLTNPLNELLLALQPVFPLDYILITVITMYFVVTSMAGIRNMGIWFFWIRLYKIRPKKTRPQALLFLCMILLLIVLHTSYMIYSLAPQYVMYGSQKYLVQMPSASSTSGNATLGTTKTCDADAPEDQCTVTRSYLFLHKFWFFSTIYYFGNWAFIGAFLIGLAVSCCRGKKSVIEGEVEADDSDLSDDEYVH
ncbi:lysosomal cobalamin transport escort protein LMBD1 [Anarrhichthys ocellatus]|uniref:lysosomal cobalamin transport escort protein LMBD1 n=1 Tax=Anarrhichthys ocellatus TaxID=433405 RepID=UPI0012ECDB59|nr:probable lysosomal cobalamin transporter [Anarrhichthys ocellatus]